MDLLELLGNVRASYAGEYTSGSLALKQIKKEIKDLRIPTMRDDEVNLKNDTKNIYFDFKKAVKEYKSNGKAKQNSTGSTK